jgi:hypothetical protein
MAIGREGRDQSGRPSFGFPTGILAVPGPCVVSDVGNWSAPCVMAALTAVVYDRQGAACTEYNRRDDNQ